MKDKNNFYSIAIAAAVLMLLIVGTASAAPYAYICNGNTNTVSVIDTATDTVTTITVGNGPYDAAVNPAGTKAYVANYFSNDVSVIDTSTNIVIGPITVGTSPIGVAFNPKEQRAYVANSGGSVSVIDTSSDNVVATVTIGTTGLRGVAVNKDGTKAYVTGYNSNKVYVINTATNTFSTIDVGANPHGIAISPDGTKAYVANSGSNTVSIIDTSSDTILDAIPVETQPYGVAFNPSGTRAYVTNAVSSSVSVIDTTSKSIITNVPVGSFPVGVAVNLDGTKAYVTNYNSDTVSVINTATNTVDISPIVVGDGPRSFGQFTPSFIPAPNYTVEKTVTDVAEKGSSANATKAGDVITYGITIKNTGNVALTNVTVSDSLISPLPSRSGDNTNEGTLDVGETWTYAPTHTVTQEELNNKGGGDGDIDNTVTVDCSELDSITNSTAVTLDYNPGYSINKTVTDVAGNGSSGHGINAGDSITYNITVKNTGNIDLTAMNVSDSLISSLPSPTGDNAATGTLNVGETWTYTPIYNITQADLNTKGGGDGFTNNTITVDCSELEAKNDSKAVVLEYNPSYSINKTVYDIIGGIAENVTKAGDVIVYKINVTNTGNIDLTNVTLNDTLINLEGYVESNTTDGILNPRETWTYTGNYTVIQTDIDDNGGGDDEFINNTATVDCDQLDLHTSSTAAHIDQTPYWVNKTVLNVAGKGPSANVTKAGDVINYQINVTNYGGLSFQRVAIYDSLTTITGPTESKTSDKVLSPGEIWIYTGNYTVTQDDLNDNGGGDGFLNNTAILNFYGGVNRSKDDKLVSVEYSSAAVPVEQHPSCAIDKTVTEISGGIAGNVTKAGDVIRYQINVTNDGNLNLTNVTLNDTLLISLSGPSESNATDGVLVPGENWTYTGNYTVTQTEINNNGNEEELNDGNITNTATVDCDQFNESKSVTVSTHIDQTPYWVNKTVTDVAGKGPLANATKAGDVITYQVNVTNYGGLPFKPVNIYDSLVPLTGPNETISNNRILDPGESWYYTGSYTVTQSDLNSKVNSTEIIKNTATADFYGGVLKSELLKVGSNSSSAEVPADYTPSFTVNKTVIDVAGNGSSANITKAGDNVTYEINVTNDGNIDLTNVTVNDSLIKLSTPEESKAEDGILNPDESWIYNVTYTVSQTEINSNGDGDGFLNNTVIVQADQLVEYPGYPKNASAAVPIFWNPVYNVNKTVIDVAGNGSDATITKAGDKVEYQVNLTNDGNVDLTNVTVNDSLENLSSPLESEIEDGILEVGEIWTLFGNYTVSQTDINNNGTKGTGFLNNTVTVDSDQLENESSSAEVPIFWNPVYNITKTVVDVAGNGSSANITRAGDEIAYHIYLTNDGNVDLTNVTVNDSLVNLTKPEESKADDGILEVGENWTYNNNYTVNQSDINSNGDGDGFLNNTVTVDSDQLEQESSSTGVPIFWNPVYNITKSVVDVAGNGSTANVTKAGDVINYLINLTNDGNVDLTNVTVNDTLINLTSFVESKNPDGIMEVGENWSYNVNYTVLQAEMNSNGDGDGFLNNTVTVDSDQLEQESAIAGVPIIQNPAYNISKIVLDIGGRGPEVNVTKAGDVITYQVNVTNDGNIDLTNVSVNDSLINLTAPVESQTSDLILNPGENWTYTGNYTITKADISSKGGGDSFINNTATVICTQLGEKSDSANVSLEHSPDYSINDTSVNVSGQGPSAIITAAGDELNCQFNLTNNGNVDLTNVTVNCTLFNFTGPIESLNPNGILEVGENWTYTGNYSVTQEDINNNGTTGNGFLNCNTSISCTELEFLNISSQFPIDRSPSYSIFKSSIGADETGDCIINRADDIIEYRIVVKNDGNVDLTNVSVTDSLINLTGPNVTDIDPDVLNPGELWVYTGNYSVTSNDISNESGNISNTATVVCDQLPEKNSSVEMPVARKADLSIYKSIIGIDETGDFMVNNVGDVINYQIAVRNNGDIDLTNVSVSDPQIPVLEGPTGYGVDSGVLKPGKTWVYTGNYTVTLEDMENEGEGSGYIINTATVSCDKLPNENSSTILPIIRVPIIVVIPETEVSPVLVADFTASPESGSAPLSVLFTDKSQNATNWNWDFNGDGTADSTVQNPPAYTYTTAGTYAANLTVSNANGTASKTATITVLETSTGSSDSSSSGGSSGGSSGSSSGGSSGSGEPASNIEAKEISQTFIGSGSTARFDFPKNATPVIYMNFDSKKTFGKTNTIVEMLKGKSTFASTSPSNEVYKYVNIWIGNSGIVSNNLENATVCFRVEKSWIQDKKIDQSSITLNRYSNSKWEQLQTSQSGEDSSYLYFTAKTPGFSPFAITGKTTVTGTEVQSGTGSQKPEQNNAGTSVNTENKNNTSIPANQSKKTPGFEVICGIAAIFGAVCLFRRK